MRYAMGETDDGKPYPINDPREAEIAGALTGVPRRAGDIAQRLFGLDGLFPEALRLHALWRNQVVMWLEIMLETTIRGAVETRTSVALTRPDGRSR
jgi:fructuronate reductase